MHSHSPNTVFHQTGSEPLWNDHLKVKTDNVEGLCHNQQTQLIDIVAYKKPESNTYFTFSRERNFLHHNKSKIHKAALSLNKSKNC